MDNNFLFLCVLQVTLANESIVLYMCEGKVLMDKQKTTHPEYKHEEQNPTMMLTIMMILVDQNDELLHPSH